MSAVLIVILMTAAALGLLVGLGFAFSQALRLGRSDDGPRWTSDFWFGFAGLIAALPIWHLFLPINLGCVVLFGLLGVAGLAWKWRSGQPAGGERSPRWGWLSAVPLLAVMLLLAITIPKHFDSGYYHFNSVRWANEYALVPGLGNLFAPFAFNQSGFLYVAFLNELGPGRYGHNVANLLLFSVVGLELVALALNCWRAEEPLDPVKLFPVVALPFLAFAIDPNWSIAGRSLSSPAPDAMIYALSIPVFLRLSRLCFPATSEDQFRRDFALCVLLSAAAITVKLTFGIFGAATIVVSAWLFTRRRLPGSWSRALPALTIAGAMGAVWIGRNILLSGYPIYPTSLLPVQTDWLMPRELVRAGEAVIASWARVPHLDPDKVLANSDWMTPWLRNVSLAPDIINPVTAFAAGLVAVILISIGKRRGVMPGWTWLPFIPPAAALVHWFCVVPDPRFAAGTFLCLGAWSLAIGLSALLTLLPPSRKMVLITLSLAGAAFISSVECFDSRENIRAVEPIPKARLTKVRSERGVEVYVAAGEFSPWDSPIPSAPIRAAVNPQLEYRHGTIGSGFRIASPPSSP